MFTIPLDQIKLPNSSVEVENVGVKWVRTTSTLAIGSAVFYPLWRGWVAFVSQFEYIRQATGELNTPWRQRTYRVYGEALSKIVQVDGVKSWYRGIGPFLCMTPIVSFVAINRSIVKKRYPKDDYVDNASIRVLVHVSAAIVAEFLCFPFRYAYILMASEPIGLPKPRPTARQIMSDLFKYGGHSKTLWWSFVPASLASIFATLPSRSENSALGFIFVSYILNLMSIRLIVALIPGAPRPYTSILESVLVHFKSSSKTWVTGLLAFMIPLTAIASTRTQLDSLYYRYIRGIDPHHNRTPSRK